MLPAPIGATISKRSTILVPRVSDTVLGYDVRRMVLITHARERALGAAVIRRETPGFYIISLPLYRADTRTDISLHIALHRIAGEGDALHDGAHAARERRKRLQRASERWDALCRSIVMARGGA
jgi:hypothetical protein